MADRCVCDGGADGQVPRGRFAGNLGRFCFAGTGLDWTGRSLYFTGERPDLGCSIAVRTEATSGNEGGVAGGLRLGAVSRIGRGEREGERWLACAWDALETASPRPDRAVLLVRHVPVPGAVGRSMVGNLGW